MCKGHLSLFHSLKMEAQPSKALLPLLLMITFIFNEKSSSAVLDHAHNLLHNSSSCGDVRNITFPFRLEVESDCGLDLSSYRLCCKKNRTMLRINREDYHVQAINYHNYTIRISSSNVEKRNCSSIPSSSLSSRDIPWIFSVEKTYTSRSNPKIPEALNFLTCEKDNCTSTPFYTSSISDLGDLFVATDKNPKLETEIRFRHTGTRQISETITFLSCGKPVLNNPSYIDATPCIKNKGSNYSYVVYSRGFKFSDVEESCQVWHKAIVPTLRTEIASYEDIHNELGYGFELSWIQAFQEGKGDRCYVDEEDSNKVYCRSPGFCSSVWIVNIKVNVGPRPEPM